MDLLFEKSQGAFAHEIKNAIGFIDADFVFRKMRQDIRSATQQLVDVIGLPTYKVIHDEYMKEDSDATKKKTLVDLAQAAIGLQAYRFFAPANDLAHTPNGRKMRNSDNEVNPFEWMSVKNDDELQRRSFRAIDDLIAYLDENLDSWKNSTAYQNTHKQFIRDTSDFDQFFNINSRLLLLKLSPGIALCEKREITPRIGLQLFNSLKDKRKSDININPNEEALISLIQEACAYASLAWGFPRLQMTLFPEGILHDVRSERSNINARQKSEAMHVDSMAQHFQNDANKAFKEIEAFITEHYPPTIEQLEPLDVKKFVSGQFDSEDIFINT